jgi:hypothetical protein
MSTEYNNAQYVVAPITGDTMIRIDINGVTSFVPLDGNNTDYGTIQDLIASGDLVVAPADVL